MSRNMSIRSLAWLARVLTTLLMSLWILAMVQMIVWRTTVIFWTPPQEPPIKAPEPSPEEKLRLRIENAQTMFLPDGTLHLVYSEPKLPTPEAQKIEVYDTGNQLLWQGFKKDSPYQYLWDNPPQKSGSRDRIYASDLDHWHQVLELQRDLTFPVLESPSGILERWRYDSNRKLFEGFDKEGRKIGYMAANGFSQNLADTKNFDSFESTEAMIPEYFGNFTVLWQTKQNIYEIRFADRRVDLLYHAENPDIWKIELIHWWKSQTDPSPCRPMIIAWRGTNACDLILKDSHEIIPVKIPLQDKSSGISFEATSQGIYMYITGTKGTPSSNDSKAWDEFWKEHQTKPFERWITLYQIDPKGEVKQRNHFEWTKTPAPMTSWEKHRQNLDLAAHKLVTSVSPIAYHWAWQTIFKSGNYKRGIGEVFTWVVRELRPANKTANILLAAIMSLAVLAHAWPRRKNPAAFLFWIAFTLIFSLAGLLTYLGLNHTKVIRCPACQKRRSLLRPDCPACRSPLPVPNSRPTDLLSTPAPASITPPPIIPPPS